MIVPSTGGPDANRLHCCKQDRRACWSLSRHRPRLLNRKEINQSVRPRIVTPNTRMGLVVAMILCVIVCASVSVCVRCA